MQVFTSAVYTFATFILTHQTPITTSTQPASSLWPNEFFTTPSLQEMCEIVKRESQNEKYVPFFRWFTVLMEDRNRRNERIPVMANYVFKGFNHILKTSPFPIPPRLEHMYALLWDVDRLLDEKKKMEPISESPRLRDEKADGPAS